ncbi:hypothetical protein ACFQU2_21580 [Siccirubricoccus deserti]
MLVRVVLVAAGALAAVFVARDAPISGWWRRWWASPSSPTWWRCWS